MDLDRAYRILHADEKDTPLTIKRKYRRMMRKYHPDAAAARAAVLSDDPGTEDEYRRMSQLLNEAYESIKKSPGKPPYAGAGAAGEGKDKGQKREINPAAFCERTVFTATSVFFPDEDDREHYKEGVRGRFYWDPDLEEFSSLLKSVNAETIRLMQDIEEKQGIYNEQEHPRPDLRGRFQARIFHLLMQEYIRPLTCLKKLEEYVAVTDEALAFYVSGSLLVRGAENVRAADELTKRYYEKGGFEGGQGQEKENGRGEISPLSFEMELSRIRVSSRESGFLGYLSFEDDSLYYIILPLLARGCADLEIYPKAVRPQKKTLGRTGILYVNLILTVRGEEEADRPGRGALMIASLLKEYEAALRGMV